MQHWSELVDTICDLQGTYSTEFKDIERAVDVARQYVRDLRFPLLLQELDEETLDGACLEADGLVCGEADTNSLHTPTVMALTFSAYSLLNGDGLTPESADTEESCERVGAFILMEKMRRMNVYGKMTLPFDPWDNETVILCEDENKNASNAFKRFLGYHVEDDLG